MSQPDETSATIYEWFEQVAGTWRGVEQLSPSPWSPGGEAEGRHTFSTAIGGRNLLQDYAETRAGEESLSGHGVFTVDPESGEVLWFWFDSFGFPPLDPARGAVAGDTLTLEKTTVRGSQRTTFARDGDELAHRIEYRAPGAGEFAPLVVATLRRAS
jgi:hypothetical protein